MAMRFDILQGEHAAWAAVQFPGYGPDSSFLGIVEELGELAAARISLFRARREGDRDAINAATDDERDAIGDLIVFISDYCTRRGFDLAAIMNELFDTEDFCDFQAEVEFSRGGEYAALVLQLHVGRLAHAQLKARQGIRGTAAQHEQAEREAIAEILVALAQYCTHRYFDLDGIVAATWAEVRKRDWRKNPLAGEAPPAASPEASPDERPVTSPDDPSDRPIFLPDWTPEQWDKSTAGGTRYPILDAKKYLRGKIAGATLPSDPEVYPARRSTNPYDN